MVNIMGSSSNPRKCKFDVFLSFRDSDTRHNFTSHLYDALDRKKIKTFIDDGLERGEEIEGSLLKTIEESMISVIIFSENYASSPWCLDGMVKILECREAYGQEVLPVFYNVDPSDVAEQKKGKFKAHLATLQKKFKEKVPRWSDDLKKAATLSGWDSREFRPDATLVRDIVDTILNKLTKATSRNLEGLIGIDSRISRVKRLLHMESANVYSIGIWGMSGIGKTTIAEAVFDNLSSQFEGCCFLKNIKEKSGELDGLRGRLLCEILGEKTISRVESGSVDRRLKSTKVLLVLDDVNDVDQIDALIGRLGFGLGSRVIITSIDKQVLKCRASEIYEVDELNDDEALQLFNSNAFKNICPMMDKMELANKAVKYANGNPFVLKVLGVNLCDKRKEVWESALDKLAKSPNDKIFLVLRLSFDALNVEQKNMFLDIACFFRGRQIDFVKRILDGCGFSAEIGISVLADKCFVIVKENKVEMHDLFQEMAHEIVRQESIKELGKRSRLWSSDDAYKVLTEDQGTKSIEGIFFDTYKMGEVKLSSRAFVRMHNLRLLQIHNSRTRNSSKVHLPYGLKSLPNELRYLHWEGYPMKSMPSRFQPEKLVELNLGYSNVRQLWTGVQNLSRLKVINLGNSELLTSFPDLSQAKNLENVNFDYCTSLEEIPTSVRVLNKLNHWSMRFCTGLKSLPRGFKLLRSLENLNLHGCSNLGSFPEIAESVKYINLNETAIEELPGSIGNLSRLRTLNLKNCKRLRNLPESIHLLKSLEIIDLSGCSGITRFPDISGYARYLYLSQTSIEEIPSSIGHLSKLCCLDLTKCKGLKDIPSDVSKLHSLEILILSGCSSITEFPEVPWKVKNLFLDGTNIVEIPSSIVLCSDLIELNLANCRRFQILPSSICMLKSLQKLNLSGCSKFENFPEILEDMRSLRCLYLNGTAMRKLPSPMEKLMELSSLEMGYCGNLNKCYDPKINVDMQCLCKLYLNNCCLPEVPDWIGCLSSLEAIDLSGNDMVEIPKSLNKLVRLQYLGLRDCKRLMSLPDLPPHLTKLDAHNCVSLASVSIDSIGIEGNIFEFPFTNCRKLTWRVKHKIMAYALTKFCLYSKRLHSQIPSLPAGESSFCFPVENLVHDSIRGCYSKIQLPSQWANSNFWGFVVQAVIRLDVISEHGFQVKCTYHFRNEYGDCDDVHCYFSGWYSEQYVMGNHMFVGFDPCVEVTKDDQFKDYSEVAIELFPQDMSGHPLPPVSVIDCGVWLIYSDDDFRLCPFLQPTCWDDLDDTSLFCKTVITYDEIMSYLERKLRFYTEGLQNQMPYRSAGEFDFGVPADMKCRRISDGFPIRGPCTKVQLPSQWADSNFGGFLPHAVIRFDKWPTYDFQVQCKYHFTNEYGDCYDHHHYFSGGFIPCALGDHIFFGFDEYAEVTGDDRFSRYKEVWVEFILQYMDGHPLPDVDVIGCGLQLIYWIDNDDDFIRFSFLGQFGYDANDSSVMVDAASFMIVKERRERLL